MANILDTTSGELETKAKIADRYDEPRQQRFQHLLNINNFDFNQLSETEKSKIHYFMDKQIKNKVDYEVSSQELVKTDDHNKNDHKNFLSDKPIVSNCFSYPSALHKLEKISTYLAGGVNIATAFSQLTSIPNELKQTLSKAVNFLTNLSFVFYGADGIRIGAMKKNPYQTFGFLLELITVWLSDVKMKYLIRGAGTGTDQIWVATDHKLKEDHGIEEGRFETWMDGLVKVPKTCIKMVKEIINDPKKTIFTLKPKGHNALISSIGDITASIGFALTKNESIFGPVRDLAGALFDWELLLSRNILQKISGVLFILESAFDFIARYMPNDNLRLFMNHLSLGAGRAALMCYKNSDANANKTNEYSFV
jgi:hypothetical protein